MTTLKTNPRTVSICCHGEVLDAMAGNTRDGVTHYFVCSECNRATDAIELPDGAERLLRKKLAQAIWVSKVTPSTKHSTSPPSMATTANPPAPSSLPVFKRAAQRFNSDKAAPL